MTWRAARRQVFPEHVSQKLKHGEAVISEAHDCVTVLFSDIVGYTSMSTSVNTADVFDMLNKLYTAFDALSDKHGVYKVDTIGDGTHLTPQYKYSVSHAHICRLRGLCCRCLADSPARVLGRGASPILTDRSGASWVNHTGTKSHSWPR